MDNESEFEIWTEKDLSRIEARKMLLEKANSYSSYSNSNIKSMWVSKKEVKNEISRKSN